MPPGTTPTTAPWATRGPAARWCGGWRWRRDEGRRACDAHPHRAGAAPGLSAGGLWRPGAGRGVLVLARVAAGPAGRAGGRVGGGGAVSELEVLVFTVRKHPLS